MDRKVPTLVLDATVDEMVEELKKHPIEEDDVEWTYEVEDWGINFFQNEVLVERWVSSK